MGRASYLAALCATIWLWTCPASAEIISPHCFKACPDAALGDAGVVRHQAYTLAINPETKVAQWVAYKVTVHTLGPARPRRWAADPFAPDAAVLEPDDYRHAATQGYDRGHLAPLASLAGLDAWAESNFATNLAPQTVRLNRGAWARQEARERGLVRRNGYDAVYVVVVPLYERPMPPLPLADEPHRVPSGFEKRITAIKGSHIRRWVVRFDQ